MQKFPIISRGEWVQLTYQEAETREEALLKAAQEWVDSCLEDFNPEDEIPFPPVRLDPEGIKGQFTPNIEIVVQQRRLVLNPDIPEDGWSPDLGIPFQIYDGWETESTWMVPDEP